MGSRRILPLLALMSWMSPAACKKPVPAAGKTIIRFLAGPDVSGFTWENIQKFEEMNPDVHVEIIPGPAATDGREAMYEASFLAKQDVYDMVYMDVAWLPKMASQGWLRPLDDLFTLEEQAQFLPGDISGSKYQGKIYRVPTHSDGGLLYYRKDLLEAQGFQPPATWDELVSVARKIQKPPQVWGFVFEGKRYEGLVCGFLELVWGNGGTLIDDQGSVRIDSPEAVQALTWLVDAVRKGGISPKEVLAYQEDEALRMFRDGRAVFMRNWPYAWNLLQDGASPVKDKVGILPMVHGPGGRSAAVLGGWGYGISAFSKHPDEAWRFIQFASTPESQKLVYLKGGIIPARSKLFEDPDIIRTSPHYTALREILGNARPRPVHPAYARISAVLQKRVSAALAGKSRPKEALELAAKEIREIVSVK